MRAYEGKPCPACGAGVGERCRTATGRVTDIHHARIFGEVASRNHLRIKKGPRGTR